MFLTHNPAIKSKHIAIPQCHYSTNTATANYMFIQEFANTNKLEVFYLQGPSCNVSLIKYLEHASYFFLFVPMHFMYDFHKKINK